MAPTFTLAPKTAQLVEAGVPPSAWPTLYALTDHADNESGRCWPRMTTIAAKLGYSLRTVQRHVRRLVAAGFLEINHRTRHADGTLGGYVYTVAHIATVAAERARKRAENREKQDRSRARKKKGTTGHRSPTAGDPPMSKRTRRGDNNPPNPPKRGEERESLTPLPEEHGGEALERKRSLVREVSEADGRDRTNIFEGTAAAGVEGDTLVLVAQREDYAAYVQRKYPDALARNNIRVTHAAEYAAAKGGA